MWHAPREDAPSLLTALVPGKLGELASTTRVSIRTRNAGGTRLRLLQPTMVMLAHTLMSLSNVLLRNVLSQWTVWEAGASMMLVYTTWIVMRTSAAVFTLSAKMR